MIHIEKILGICFILKNSRRTNTSWILFIVYVLIVFIVFFDWDCHCKNKLHFVNLREHHGDGENFENCYTGLMFLLCFPNARALLYNVSNSFHRLT